MEDIAPGTLIAGRYRVERLLGTGSVKRVYLARDVLTRRDVAVGVLRVSPEGDPTLGPRFSREARAASALGSPFVVRVLDVGKLGDGTRYMVTEAVLGRSLDAAIRRGAAPPEAAARWVAQVLAALAEAHRKGVLHRDVKPENVLLDPVPGDPVGEVARLTDFGLAKVLDAQLEGSVTLRTAQGVVMGTPDYMSPEQWVGVALDARSDLYAAGAMFHELLLGRPPFAGPGIREFFAQHHFREVEPFPEGVAAEVRAFEAIVRRALAKRPVDRFESADAMRAAIESAGGFSVGEQGLAVPRPEEPIGVFSRAEVVTDVAVGPVQLVASPRLVLGRTGHAVVRCVPKDAANEQRSLTVSRHHARVEWRGGQAWVVDLGSRTGTSAGGRAVTTVAPGVALKSGDEVGLGPCVRFRFEHASAPPGVLPAWARFTRVDPYGVGIAHVMVLTEASAGGESRDAIQLPAELTLGERVVFRAAEGVITVAAERGDHDALLADGQVWKVGRVTLVVAMETLGA